MASSGASKAIVAKHPDVTTHSSSTHAAEGTTSSASSASTSRSEGRSAGGLNSRNRAAVRLSQLERLKAHRQSAQAGREAGQRAPGMAALERQPPSHTVRQPTTSASRPGERPSGPGSAGVGSSMPLPRGVARTGQRSTSKGYLDRYAASCAVSGKDAKPLKRQQEAESAQLEEQVSTGVGHRTRSGAFVRLSSAESRTGAPDTGKHDQEAMTAALYNLAEAEQQRPATGVSCSDTAPLSSHASVASQPAASADGHLSTSDSGRIEDTGQDRCSFRLDSVHDQAGLPGLAEAELGGLPNECPQAPGRTKPLPQADAPVCSPHTHPEGSHASSASPARLRSPLPTPGVPASSTDVLFVQPPPEIAAVPRVVKAVESIKDTGRQAPLAASADGSLQLMVNLHAYAAAGLPRHGDVAQQHDPVASIIELGPTKAASLDKLRTPLTSVEEGPAHQFWEVQKRVVDVSAVPAQQRPRNLPKFLAGLCSCFAPQPHASPEPVMMNLCMTPG
ncbi:hypothetical protein MMC34_008782, partial [Xylographa carneopallida]|nr:hypothetical protein [Xylographa carneopallida]